MCSPRVGASRRPRGDRGSPCDGPAPQRLPSRRSPRRRRSRDVPGQGGRWTGAVRAMEPGQSPRWIHVKKPGNRDYGIAPVRRSPKRSVRAAARWAGLADRPRTWPTCPIRPSPKCMKSGVTLISSPCGGAVHWSTVEPGSRLLLISATPPKTSRAPAATPATSAGGDTRLRMRERGVVGVEHRVPAVADDAEGADECPAHALAAERLDRKAPQVGDEPDRGAGAAQRRVARRITMIRRTPSPA